MNWLVFSLFFVSGACALIYQVVWTRIMTHVFGSTVFAVSTVLTAFMTGLAIGSYFLGKRADHSKNTLRLYAHYEIWIGVTALVSLFLMDRLIPLYLWLSSTFGDSILVLNLSRFIIAFLLLIVPSTLMGATLPILSKYVITRLESLGRLLGSLYAINTLGAVLGSLAAGFFLIGSVGIHMTIYIAATLNVAVGCIAWVVSRKKTDRKPGVQIASLTSLKAEGHSSSQESKRLYRFILWAIAVSGFTSFAYEVYWTRALVFVLGNSTYAFVTMLTAFLMGISLGAYSIRFFVDKLSNPVKVFAWVEISIGFFAALAMPILVTVVYSPSVQALFGQLSAQWGSMLLLRFGVSFLVMFVPTALIGATFPLVAKIYIKNLGQTGTDVGKIYAVNTLGNIFGALIPGFLILPFLGIHKSILLMSALNLSIGAIILFVQSVRFANLRYLSPVIFMLIVTVIAFLPLDFQFPSDTQTASDKVLFYREGIAATTKVYQKRETGEKHISVDGVSIGGSGYIDKKQEILAHLPKLLLSDYESELSIGLGSGILVGESARHGRLRNLVCVEIAPTVVQGASYFAKENHDIFHNPKIHIEVNDGVNYLLTSSEQFDIISTDAKSRPEHGGNGVFFSKDYYDLMKDHLTAKGLVIQWIPMHFPPEDYKMVLKTFTDVFPYASLWYFPPDNSFLVGSKNKITVDVARVERILTDPGEPFDGLRKYGLTSGLALLSHFVTSEKQMKEKTKSISVNSLEHPYIEFYSLRDYAVPSQKRTLQNLKMVLSMRSLETQWLQFDGASTEEQQRLREAFQAEGIYLQALKELYRGTTVFNRVHEIMEGAVDMAPWNDDIRYHVSFHLVEQGRSSITGSNYSQAEELIKAGVETYPKSVESHYLFGALLAKRGALEQGIDELKKAISLSPRLLAPRQELAAIYVAQEKYEEAVTELKDVIQIDPENIIALNNLGWYLAQAFSNHGEALIHLQKAYELEPENPGIIDSYAWVAYRSGNIEQAREIIMKGGRYYKGNRELEQRRDLILGSKPKRE